MEAYCPPGTNLKEEDYHAFLNILGYKFTVGGDVNAKNTQCIVHIDQALSFQSGICG